MEYVANSTRYNKMQYRYCGDSGLQLPLISFGLWHNFGSDAKEDVMKSLCFTAFDLGITYFDLANNYGPVAGSAEINFGKILNTHLKSYRDEMVIATKAGYGMWEGPYGDWGSRKYLITSLNQSLKRMNLDYVDVFYHHRMDPNTPLEETMLALADIVRSGKALYVGLSNYDGKTMTKASKLLDELKVPFIMNQNRYSMLDPTVEKNGLQKACVKEGKGLVAFCPLEQGVLSGKYINNIPDDSRIKTSGQFLKESSITDNLNKKVSALHEIAVKRGQSLSQMALSYLLSQEGMTTVLIGASKPEQLIENCNCLFAMSFTIEELDALNSLVQG